MNIEYIYRTSTWSTDYQRRNAGFFFAQLKGLKKEKSKRKAAEQPARLRTNRPFAKPFRGHR